jgi:hypothetical protein
MPIFNAKTPQVITAWVRPGTMISEVELNEMNRILQPVEAHTRGNNSVQIQPLPIVGFD